MNFSIIQKTQLEGAERLDAEYYQPEYLLFQNSLESTKTNDLEEVAFVSGGKRLPVGEIFSDSGVPYLRIVDVFNTYVDLSQIRSISKRLHNLLKKYQIQNQDILITIVGNTVGLVGYNQTAITPFNFTENFARVRSKKYQSQYILAVMLSRVGQLQVERESVGAAQPKLSLDRLRKFKIPIPSSILLSILVNIVNDSLNEYKNSEDLYKESENLLLEELGLKDFKSSEDLSYAVNYSDTESVERIDAEYFQPKYQLILEKFKTKSTKTLSELVSLKKGFEPGSEAYQHEGKLFIRVSSLSKNGVEDKDQKYLSDELYQKLKPDYEPKVGEILLTKDATPGISYVVKEPIEGIISGGILRLKLKSDIEPEYLSLCISSMIGQMQAERDAGGSIIVHWKPEQIRSILIPVLSKETQQKIADLVKKSHEARKKSKELLEEAKRKVEEMIEKGGD